MVLPWHLGKFFKEIQDFLRTIAWPVLSYAQIISPGYRGCNDVPSPDGSILFSHDLTVLLLNHHNKIVLVIFENI